MRSLITLLISASLLALPFAASAATVSAPQELHAIVPCDTCSPGITSASAVTPEGGAYGTWQAPQDGNALLRHLDQLFVLNALFSNYSNGVLTPGPASLGNILILYQIFFAQKVPDQSGQ